MKIKYLPLLATAMLFAACDDNEQPEFADADAFVAFTSSTATVSEVANSEEASVTSIYVKLSSVAGLTKSATVEVVDTAELTGSDFENTIKAVEGVNYRILSSKELKFDAENRQAEIKIAYIPDGIYTGDMKFKLIVKSDDANVGHESECIVTLSDNEHPLQAILGDYTASADSYFSSRGHFNWTVTISKDATDVSKVYIDNLDPYFAANGYKGHLAGVVNDEKTEIAVAAGQDYGYKTVTFEVFSTADPDDANAVQLKASENMIISIKDGGATLVVENSFGTYDDGWWNLMYGELVLTKK